MSWAVYEISLQNQWASGAVDKKISFIGRGNLSTRRKTQTCCKSL